ncbi:MAG TPA: LysM domain-containing protein [Polyangiaceae bacterium]|nr:LysM domain-containing protein [Polyangiaceae bacterium]
MKLAAFALLLCWSSVALGQAPGPSPNPSPSPPPSPSPGPDPGPGNPSNATGNEATPAAPPPTVYQPLGLPAPGTDLYPGLPSSSRPIVGDERDGFDLGQSERGPAIVHGEKGATGVLAPDRAPTAPDLHLVRRGDTLWDLSAAYFHTPWQWPSIWKYNPQIQNPHWIYPGDQVRLRNPNELSTGSSLRSFSLGRAGGRFRGVGGAGADSVFLRDQGFIGDPKRDVWGELVGAVEEQMLLSEGNRVYLVLRPSVNVTPGQELTIFRSVRQPDKVPGARKPPGEVVAINGTVRIERFDPKTRIAQAEVTESVDAIERGAKVGPVRRRFDMVPPKPNRRVVEARVLTSLYPHVYLAQNQVVFLDRGSSDGLEPGNTLFVFRRGDTWRKSLATASSMVRDRLKMDSPATVDIETTPLRGDPEKFPEETVAEIRVLRVEKQSSVGLVTQSRRELVPGDRARARQGR